MKNTLFRPINITILIALLTPAKVCAWGQTGHAAIVRLAFQLMPIEQRQRLYVILGTQNPWEIGNWADRKGLKEHPESKGWHYANIPADATRYQESYCDKDCIISELSHLERSFRAANLGDAKRREDVFFYIHFLSDLYQPFHNLGPTGANDVPVTLPGRGKQGSLHWVWDVGIISRHKIDTVALLALARKLKSDPLETDYRKIAMECHTIAVANLVRRKDSLPANYVEAHWPIVERAMVLAALQIVARTKDL